MRPMKRMKMNQMVELRRIERMSNESTEIRRSKKESKEETVVSVPGWNRQAEITEKFLELLLVEIAKEMSDGGLCHGGL